MKLFGTAGAVLAVVAPALSYSKTYHLTYDSFYDDGKASLASVTCAHGENGLLTKGYTTFDSLPSFPFIGAAPQISGTDSSYCGSCWEMTYSSYGISVSVNFTAIDAGKDDSDTFSVSLEGMDYLTRGMAWRDKTVSVTVTRKTSKACHLD